MLERCPHPFPQVWAPEWDLIDILKRSLLLLYEELITRW